MLMAGLPPLAANASNAVAVSPGHLMAVIADHEKLPRLDRRLALLVAATTSSSCLGAALLLLIPESAFLLPIPFLIGFATLLFAFSPKIQTWSASGRLSLSAKQADVIKTSVLFLVSVYGGFFGAGLGVLLTAILSISDPNDIRRVKVLKNLLATSVSLIAIAIFTLKGIVNWPATIVMLAGALAGGYAGGHLIRILPVRLVQHLVVASGVVMTIYYAWKI